jgi:hypothetical protein
MPKENEPPKNRGRQRKCTFSKVFDEGLLAKPSTTAIKSEHIFRILISPGLLMATLTKKMNQESYNFNLIQGLNIISSNV